MFRKLLEQIGTKHLKTAPYTPSTNGQTERFNKTLCESLAKMADENNDGWDRFIDSTLFTYRTRKHSATKETPFKLMFGVEANLTNGGNNILVDIEKRLNRDQQLALLHIYRLEQEERSLLSSFDKKNTLYNIGDIVKFVIGYKRHRDKLLPKTDAPYRIVNSNNKGSYDIEPLKGSNLKKEA